MEGFPISSAKGLVLFFCSIKLFSAVAGPIDAKFGTRVYQDACLKFWGATPRDSEIIAQNVRVHRPIAVRNFAKKLRIAGKLSFVAFRRD